MTVKERIRASELIVSFVDETCGPHDWDDFIMPKAKDPDFQLVCDFCNCTQDLYPTAQGWYNNYGNQMLRKLAEMLRSHVTFKQIRAFIVSDYASATHAAAVLKKFDTPPIP
jgi:uncharacterized protein YdaL